MVFDIDALTEIYLKDKEHDSVIRAEIQQRVDIISKWDIAPGSRILEIGCGQGDCTLVLADAVGPDGHVTGLDPASLDYGSPWTLGEAQAFLLASPLKSRMTFIQIDPQIFLQEKGDTVYDCVVFCHSIWYFDTPAYLSQMLHALRGKTKRVLIAEYALETSDRTTLPHVLAALSQAALASNQTSSESNIRSLLSPARIRLIAEKAGWVLSREDRVVHGDDLLEGKWETGNVLNESFEEEIMGIEDEKQRYLLLAMRDTVVANSKFVGGQQAYRLRTMDSWVGSFQ